MATESYDSYIKFGESTNLAPDGKSYLPQIEGDSSDETHYWWCELRGYDFSLEAGERDSGSEGAEGDQSQEKPKPSPGANPKELSYSSAQKTGKGKIVTQR